MKKVYIIDNDLNRVYRNKSSAEAECGPDESYEEVEVKSSDRMKVLNGKRFAEWVRSQLPPEAFTKRGNLRGRFIGYDNSLRRKFNNYNEGLHSPTLASADDLCMALGLSVADIPKSVYEATANPRVAGANARA